MGIYWSLAKKNRRWGSKIDRRNEKKIKANELINSSKVIIEKTNLKIKIKSSRKFNEAIGVKC